MDYHQKVLWSEGMFLTPHHFQQWDRYHEYRLHQSLKMVQALDYGLCQLKIDTDALAGGDFVLTQCAGIMPDGLAFNVPDFNAPPAVRAITPHFEPKADRLGVYLSAPVMHPGAKICSPTGEIDGKPTRYRNKTVMVVDDYAGANEREVTAAATNLAIMFSTERLDDLSYIKIAELTRTATGAFALSESYIPPCLYASASPILMAMLRRMLEMLSARSAELAKQRRQRTAGGGLSDISASEAAVLLFLHTVNASVPALQHYYHRAQVHPERLYLEMAHLAGKLYTFGGEGHPKDLPLYVHDDLGTTFTVLDEKLRQLLETIIATRYRMIELKRARDRVFAGRMPDDLLTGAELYMSVSANVPTQKLVTELPIKAKITSFDRVDRLIAQALRGLDVVYLAAPPAEIPVQPGYSYFKIEQSGGHWEAVTRSRTIAFYIPPEFADLKLELGAVKKGE